MILQNSQWGQYVKCLCNHHIHNAYCTLCSVLHTLSSRFSETVLNSLAALPLKIFFIWIRWRYVLIIFQPRKFFFRKLNYNIKKKNEISQSQQSVWSTNKYIQNMHIFNVYCYLRHIFNSSSFNSIVRFGIEMSTMEILAKSSICKPKQFIHLQILPQAWNWIYAVKNSRS